MIKIRTGHVARMVETRNAYRFSVEKPEGIKLVENSRARRVGYYLNGYSRNRVWAGFIYLNTRSLYKLTFHKNRRIS